MPDIKTEIKNQIAEMSLHEAIRKVTSVLRSNSDFIGLKARSNSLEREHHEQEITKETYNVELVNLRKSLFFFIDRLKEDDLKKIFVELIGNVVIKENEKATKALSILFVAAIPKDQDHLQVDYEFASIKNVIASSEYRQNFTLQPPILASTIDTLTTGISVIKPAILHFSGHAGKKGIILSDSLNNAEIIPTNILDAFFGTFDKTLQCVFLNACYSAEQAKVISKHATYVIGMNCPIGDDAAIIFSAAFYNFICNDIDINFERAFKQSKIKLTLKKSDESNTPEIWKEGLRIDI